MISVIDVLKLVFKVMSEKKKRVLLTISGIIIGIFTFTFFIFVSQGLSNAISEQFSSLGTNVLVVTSANSGGGGPPSGGEITDNDLQKVKQVVRGYNYISPFQFHTTLFEYGREKEAQTTLGYPIEYWDKVYDDLGLEIEFGRFLRQGDKNALILGAKAAQDSYEDEVRVGSVLKYEGKSYRVIGILKERGDLFVDGSILTTFDDVSDISGEEKYSGIRVSLEEGVDFDLQKEAILRKLNPNNNEKRVEITSPEQAIEQFNQILGVLTFIISFVSSIALLVGGINVMNTMYSNVLERINEISVLKAMGATQGDVLKLYLTESSFLGLIGGLIGFFGAFAVAKMVSSLITTLGYNVPVYFDMNFFIIVIVVTTLAATAFGGYPAYRAIKVNPADNLRDD